MGRWAETKNRLLYKRLQNYKTLRPKIKFYLFSIATRPTEKLAAKIILFAFQTIFFIKKNRNRAGISIVSADFFPGFIYFKSRS